MIARRFIQGFEQRATLREPPDWLWDAFGASATYTGKSVTETGSLGLIPVFSAVRILATGVGSLPMAIYKGTARKRVLADDTRQWMLFHEDPNPDHSADQWFETVEGHLNLWGNYYAEKVKGAGVVGELWPLSPAKVKPQHDKQGRKVFEVEGEKTQTDETILHIPAWGYDGLTGLSPIAQARQALGAAFAREEYEARLYSNNGQPGGIVKFPGSLSDEAIRRFKSEWNARMGGLRNMGSIGVLEDGAEWVDTGIPLRDLQFVEGQQFSATQIAMLFQVPPSWIGGKTGDSLTYSTVEGEALHFVKFSLRPWLVRIERAIRRDRDLFPDRDMYPKFQVEELLRGDSTAQANFFKSMRELGVYSPNDIREKLGEPPREGGDVYQDTPQGAAPNQPAEPKRSNGHHPERTPEAILS